MTYTKRDEFIKRIFSMTAPYIDRLSAAFSLGLSRLWRKKAVELSGVKRCDSVLDVCTGTGELAFAILKRLGPTGSVTGIDFCPEMIEIAKQKTRRITNPHSRRISFETANAKALPFLSASFDLVTVAFGMRNIPDTKAALKEIHRVLRPGGRFVCLELTRPTKRWFLPLYKWYVFRVMPRIGRMVLKKSTPYTYLPRSIEAFYPREEFTAVIEDCGFSNISVRSMTLGVATIFTATKP